MKFHHLDPERNGTHFPLISNNFPQKIAGFVKNPSVPLRAGLRFNPAPLDKGFVSIYFF
jgi:hypothetical protein